MIADSIAWITGSQPLSKLVCCAVNVAMRCRRRCVRLQRGASGGRFGGGETGQSFKEVIGLAQAPNVRGRRRRQFPGWRTPSQGYRRSWPTRCRELRSLEALLSRDKTSYQGRRKGRGSEAVRHSCDLPGRPDAVKSAGVPDGPAVLPELTNQLTF